MQTVQLKIFKEDIHFAAAHFTIFSATERERLHGHNYFLQAECQVALNKQEDISVDYRLLKKSLRQLCQTLDEYLLLPAHSPYLQLIEQAQSMQILFADEIMCLPKQDVKILPLANITGEGLCQWFIDNLQTTFIELDIIQATISLSSGPGQAVSLSWSAA